MSMHQEKRLEEDSNGTALPEAVWQALLEAFLAAQRRKASVWRCA